MMHRLVALGAFVALASCMQSSGLPVASSSSSVESPASCYAVKEQPQTVKATITFYGWPDNSPPGNQIAHPVIHQRAGGDGTYCNPTTFATEHSNNKRIPYGIKIYVPFLKQYFVREDLCAASGPTSGSGSNGCYQLWFDLWVGGNANSKSRAVINCELKMTPGKQVDVILWPKRGMPLAHPGPIYRNQPPPNGSCYGKRER